MKNIFICLLYFFSTPVFSQQVYIENKIFKVNGCPVYFNGANTPWNNWNDFGGNYNESFWASHFVTLKNNGINSSRVWISCNGDVQPNINADGTVTGVSAQFWQNCDHFFQEAQANGIYIMATMMSFDHTKNTYLKYTSWRNMLNDVTKVQTYIDNYLVPFVNRYKSNPYLMSIDLCNEPEWIAEDATNMQCSYAVLQNFFARCAFAIHDNPRIDGSTMLVTIGSAATKWNATKMRNGANGVGWVTNSDGNKWSDAGLRAQYNQTSAIIDYYSPHYYAWIDQWYSNPFVKNPVDFGIDEKACLIGETPGGNPGTPNLTALASYEALKSNGYQGHYPWTSNAVDSYGGIANFGAAALAFKNNYPDLIYPPEAGCNALPVDIIQFNAVWDNGKGKLTWTTLSETNIDFFTILRSSDSKNWEAIGKVKGQESSLFPIQYVFYDEGIPAGTSYYKLQLTDLNGSYEDSTIRIVSSEEITGIINVYPNPFSTEGTLSVSYNSKEAMSILISLHSISGSLVWSGKFDVQKGRNELKILRSTISKGTYLLSASSPDKYENARTILFY